MSFDRKHAIELGAVSLEGLLAKAGLFSILGQLTSAQIRQLQRYLDAAVIDPAVKKEATDIYRKGAKVYGQIVYTDPVTQRRIDKAMEEFIPVRQSDGSVRLDHAKLLDPKALTPITDNPDEAVYLEAVRIKLDNLGVWLRISQKLVEIADNPNHWNYDGRNFDAWLSLGADGHPIPSKNGRIDRDALISNLNIGGNYWAKVDNGPVMSALNRQMESLGALIEDGMRLHMEMMKIRSEGGPAVVAISDKLGGADFPAFDIWKGPHEIRMKAMELRRLGRVWGANMLATYDAVIVRNAANSLRSYMDKSTAGAAMGVKALKIVEKAGIVAGVGLGVAGGVYAAARLGAAAAGGAAAGEATLDAAVEKGMAEYLARNPSVAKELNSIKLVRGARGTVMRDGGHALKGWH